MQFRAKLKKPARIDTPSIYTIPIPRKGNLCCGVPLGTVKCFGINLQQNKRVKGDKIPVTESTRSRKYKRKICLDPVVQGENRKKRRARD